MATMINHQTTTLAAAIAQVEARHRALDPVDLERKLNRFAYLANREQLAMRPLTDEPTTDAPLLVSDLAAQQLCSRLGIPYAYFRKCQQAAPQLATANINYWSSKIDEDRSNPEAGKASTLRTVRFGDQDQRIVRAFMSDRYTPLDDADLLPMVADVLADTECEVRTLSLADEYSHLRITFPKLSTEARKGDVVQTGLNISNSEVGRRSYRIDGLAFRLICTNGMIAEERDSRTTFRHIGNASRVKDAIRNAVKDAQMGAVRLAAQFRKAVDHAIAEPLKFMEERAVANDLTTAQLQRLMASFETEPDASLFGIVNAFTDAAKGEPTFEQRFQLERIGSKLLAAA